MNDANLQTFRKIRPLTIQKSAILRYDSHHFCEQTRLTFMQQQYNPSQIEPAVQQYWAENKVFKAIKDTSKEK